MLYFIGFIFYYIESPQWNTEQNSEDGLEEDKWVWSDDADDSEIFDLSPVKNMQTIPIEYKRRAIEWEKQDTNLRVQHNFQIFQHDIVLFPDGKK